MWPRRCASLGISESLLNIAGQYHGIIFWHIHRGGGEPRGSIGRVKLIYIGLALSILGSLLIAVSPSGTAVLLMAGRIIQGLSAACIMPASLALMKAYFDGKDR